MYKLISGVPGVGKTTIVKEMLKDGSFFKFGLLRGHICKNYIILGDYRNDTEVFAGTDKLSMGVQPDFNKFISMAKLKFPNHDVIIEGDRLVGSKTIEQIKEKNQEFKLFIIEADQRKIIYRREERGSDQPAKFLKSKRTKVDNLINKYPHKVLLNNHANDIKKIVEQILQKQPKHS